jgi:hypothetical protein
VKRLLAVVMVMSSSIFGMESAQPQVPQAGYEYPLFVQNPSYYDASAMQNVQSWIPQDPAYASGPVLEPAPLIMIDGVEHVFNNGAYYPVRDEREARGHDFCNIPSSEEQHVDISSHLIALVQHLKKGKMPQLDELANLQKEVAEHPNKEATSSFLESYLRFANFDFGQWLHQHAGMQKSSKNSSIVQALRALYSELFGTRMDEQPAAMRSQNKRRARSNKHQHTTDTSDQHWPVACENGYLDSGNTLRTFKQSEWKSPQAMCAYFNLQISSLHSKAAMLRLIEGAEDNMCQLMETEEGKALLAMVDELKAKYASQKIISAQRMQAKKTELLAPAQETLGSTDIYEEGASPPIFKAHKVEYTQPEKEMRADTDMHEEVALPPVFEAHKEEFSCPRETVGRSDIQIEEVKSPSWGKGASGASTRKKKKKSTAQKNNRIKDALVLFERQDDTVALDQAIEILEPLQINPQVAGNYIWCHAMAAIAKMPQDHNLILPLLTDSLECGGPSDSFKDAQFKRFDQWADRMVGTIVKQHGFYSHLGKKEEAKRLIEKHKHLLGVVGRLYLEGSEQWRAKGEQGWLGCGENHKKHSKGCYRSAIQLIASAANNDDDAACLYLSRTKYGGTCVPERYAFIVEAYERYDTLTKAHQEKLHDIISHYASEGYLVPGMIALMGALESPEEKCSAYVQYMEKHFPPIRFRATETACKRLIKVLCEHEKLTQLAQKSWAMKTMQLSTKMMHSILKPPTLDVMKDLTDQFYEFLSLAQEHSQLKGMIPSVQAAIGKKAWDHAKRLKAEKEDLERQIKNIEKKGSSQAENEALHQKLAHANALLQEADETAHKGLAYASEYHNEDGMLYYAQYLAEENGEKGRAYLLRKELVDRKGEQELHALNHLFWGAIATDKKEAKRFRDQYEKRARERFDYRDVIISELERMDEALKANKKLNAFAQRLSKGHEKDRIIASVYSSDDFEQVCTLLNLYKSSRVGYNLKSEDLQTISSSACEESKSATVQRSHIDLSGLIDRAVMNPANPENKNSTNQLLLSEVEYSLPASSDNNAPESSSSIQPPAIEFSNNLDNETLEKAVALLHKATEQKRLFSSFELILDPFEKMFKQQQLGAAIAYLEAAQQRLSSEARKKIAKIKQHKYEYDSRDKLLADINNGNALVMILEQYPKENDEVKRALLYTRINPGLYDLFGQEEMEREFPEIFKEEVIALPDVKKITNLKRKVQNLVKDKVKIYNQMQDQIDSRVPMNIIRFKK